MDILQKLIDKIGLSRFLALLGVGVALLGFMGYLMMRAAAPDMGLLFANLDGSDGAKIMERLKLMNIPAELGGDGDQIFVPSKNIAKLRMELASDGLPAGGTIGYELFDKTDALGTTNALMDINLMRATEGEIAKSIKTIQGVQSARVHLVIPKKELFATEKQLPSASIVIKMKGASRLSVNQVLSIQHLVASAVPGLTLDHISIIDDKGTLLAKGQDSSDSVDAGSNQQEILNSYENKLSRSIESLLERTVGSGKVRAEVTAEMDFDKITSTSVDYNPDGQVARSQQSINEGSNTNEASAVDGTSAQNAQNEGSNQGGTQSKNQDNRSEENYTYEISNTTKTHVKETGGIKRLSIAVLLDGSYTKDKAGKDVYTPRSNKEIAELTDLVKTAVGFQEKRGDTIKVINMPFNETPEEPDSVSQFTRWMNAIFTQKIIDLLLMLGVGLFIYYTTVRPMALRIVNIVGLREKVELPPPPPPEPEPLVLPPPEEEDFINISHIDGRMKSSSIKKIGDLIEAHPDEAVNIIRSWMYSSE